MWLAIHPAMSLMKVGSSPPDVSLPGSETGAPLLESPAPAAAASACTPAAPTDISKGWSVLNAHNGDFSFSYPSDWEKVYGAFPFKTSSLIDSQTFAETGLGADSTTLADLVRKPGTGLPNASALIVPGVTSSNDVIYQRQVDRFKATNGVSVQRTDLTGCLGGEKALGVEILFNNGTVFQQSWYVVHAGRSYDFQWLAPKDTADTDLFAEMVRTWKFTPGVSTATPLPSQAGGPTAPPSVASAFVEAGMASSIDVKATTADPTTFTTTLSTSLKAIYAVWVLAPGSVGRVEGVLKKDGASLVLIALDYGTKTKWADFKINSATGFAAGTYQMVLTLVPTGESISLPFTVR